MDSRFLEFWGNFMLSAARGQKQMEDMARLVGQGFKAAGLEDLTAMFTKAYGLAGSSDAGGAPDDKLWETAAQQFQNSLEEYMKLMGMVPKAEHQQLKQQHEALKKKCAAQQETISHLRDLLGAGKAGQQEVVKEFQTILEKQSTQFQDLLSSSTQFLKETAPSKKIVP